MIYLQACKKGKILYWLHDRSTMEIIYGNMEDIIISWDHGDKSLISILSFSL